MQVHSQSGGASVEQPGQGPALFVNRELSWLEFNRRVLCQAEDTRVPLFERLRFLSIYFSNLDEFFMVRVGTLTDQMLVTPDRKDDKTGWNAAQQIQEIFQHVRSLAPLVNRCIRGVLDDLKAAGIELVEMEKLPKVEEQMLWRSFHGELQLLLSPQIVDHNHPFPFLGNKEEYIVTRMEAKDGHLTVGIVGVSHLPPYKIYTVDGRHKVVLTDDLVYHFIDKIYSKRKIKDKYKLRITRNADLNYDETFLDDDTDFRGVMQELLKLRKRLAVVRIQVDRPMEPDLQEYLCKRLAVSPDRILVDRGPMDFSFGSKLPKEIGGSKDMYYPETHPVYPAELPRKNLIRAFSDREVLLAFPFQSIRPFINLLEEAADDPTVVSIQISLYRLADHSKIASALMRAAENGKKVLCVLELRARFDEQSNINYASLLEEAGCTVIYGLDNLKTHAKLCLITRMIHGRISTITQVGTGNYNEKTAEQYTDLMFITPDEKVGREAAQIFSNFCMGEIPEPGERLWVAPRGYKRNLLAFIQAEIQRQREFGDGYIFIKANSMNDMQVMGALIEASQAGVQVEMIIRGICCLRPQISGYTENIRIKSIVGQYLEHSRIFQFGKGGRERMFIGSGDLLNRNTTRRVELFAELTSAQVRSQLRTIIFALEEDTVNSWAMAADGSYARVDGGDHVVDSQSLLHTLLQTSEPEHHVKQGLQRWLAKLFKKQE